MRSIHFCSTHRIVLWVAHCGGPLTQERPLPTRLIKEPPINRLNARRSEGCVRLVKQNRVYARAMLCGPSLPLFSQDGTNGCCMGMVLLTHYRRPPLLSCPFPRHEKCKTPGCMLHARWLWPMDFGLFSDLCALKRADLLGGGPLLIGLSSMPWYPRPGSLHPLSRR